MTFDHKADQPDEERRINALGGYVSDQRVLGALAVSRALGDFSLHPYVSAEPYICVIDASLCGIPLVRIILILQPSHAQAHKMTF